MKKRVLIVDDDISVRESLGKVLRGLDYEAVLAADGQEAMEWFAKGQIDLLLLDLGLPIMDGWNAFERITTENPLMPIIIITGLANQRDVAMAAGVGALMEKPLDVPRLLQTIQELLAEPKKARLLRLCGYAKDVRYIPSNSTLFLKKLREQHPTSFHNKLEHSGRDSRAK
jgi:two-component system, cell cycle response regulator DivK